MYFSRPAPKRVLRAALTLSLAAVSLLAMLPEPGAALSRQPGPRWRSAGPARGPARIIGSRQLHTRLHTADSWAFAIGDGALTPTGIERLKGYDIVVVDGESATAEQIAALRKNGAVVLAYLSVGTIESYRSWYPEVSAYRLDLWGDWGEWYAQVGSAGYRAVMFRVGSSFLDKGADGLFLDNVDMVDTHASQGAGMTTLVGQLSSAVDGRGKLLATQNGFSVVWPLRAHFDAWNREDVTCTYDFDTSSYRRTSPSDLAAALDELRLMRAEGLATMATDYAAEADTATPPLARANALSVGALSYVSDIYLTRIPLLP